MVEDFEMIEKDIYTGLTLDGKTKMNVKGIYFTPYKWSVNERRLFLVYTKKHKPFRSFERNYSKWATFKIDKFEDITILETFDKDGYCYEKGDYRVNIGGDSCYDTANDTYYEHWVGNSEVKKEYHNSERYKEYCEDLEVWLEDNELGYDLKVIASDLTAIIPKEDYLKLKEMFNEKND